MSDKYTFLQLAQEFGGTRFGPFQGVEIRLGSDPGRNDITLPESLGVAPEHLKVLIQTDGSYIIAPIERTASVFFWRGGSTRSKQINAPMAVQTGDGFSLVSAEGPRFYLQTIEKRQEAQQAAEESQGPGFRRPTGLTGSGLMGEIKRRGFSSVLATGIGQTLQRAWVFIKTGQAFQPRYVISGMLIASGWVFAGGAGCGALSFSRSKGKTQTQLTNCQDQLGISDGDDSGPTVPSLTRKILIDREWQTTVEADKDLYQAYAGALRTIFADPKKYEYVYKNKGASFARFKSALEAEGMSPNLVRVMSYAAALPGYGPDRDWALVEDSDAEEVCGRGPLGLTYAQGYRLGLSNLQLDAMMTSREASSNDLEAQATALAATAERIDASSSFDKDLIKSAGAALQGGVECMYVDGTDDRDDLRAIADQVNRQLGGGVSRGLPREGEAHWVAARIVRLYAMDFRRGYDELDFDPKFAPSVAMSETKKGRKEYAIEAAATTIARAVAIPCLATLDKEIADSPPRLHGRAAEPGQLRHRQGVRRVRPALISLCGAEAAAPEARGPAQEPLEPSCSPLHIRPFRSRARMPSRSGQ